MIANRVPRLWALWAAARPSQLALIVLVYALGIGKAAAEASLMRDGSTLQLDGDQPAFLELVVVGAIALIPVSVAIHYANEYADADTDALTERTPFSGGSGALERTGLPRS
ncbi:MAG: prenyltransferase, partial [Natronococcus sp.]